MRLGIAGCGRIAERGYIPAALATESVTIAGFADPDSQRRRGCAELWARGGGGEAPTFASVTELLADEPIDLLVIAAPAAHHLDIAADAAAAGVRSLVEKPPAPDLSEAQQLASLNPEPLVAFNRRFLQGHELRNSIPDEGWIQLDLELRFQRGAWGAHQAADEALLDAGLHLIDLACHLSGSTPIAVRKARIEHEEATLELELARGRASIACATDRSHREAVTVRDRAGKQIADWTWGGLASRFSSLIGRTDPLVLSLQRQLEAAGAPGHPHRLLATALEAATTMAVVEAARDSAALDGAEVTVAPIAGAST